jgi:hypothetical protein
MALTTATWTCDRDGTVGTSQTELPPEGWWSIQGFCPEYQVAKAVLCPNCAAAHAEFIGTSFAPRSVSA